MANEEGPRGAGWIELRGDGMSATAADAIRFKFNPSNLDEVAEIKTLTGHLISRMESIRDRDGGKAGREAAVAITNIQTASMWCVLAATKGK